MNMSIQFIKSCVFLIAILFALASYGAEVPVPQPAKPQNGVFKLANGYSSTVLELKDGYFRYWFKSDVSLIDAVTGREPLYPLAGKYLLKGDTVVLENAQIFQKQWTFRMLNGVLTLWRTEAIDYYNSKKGFDSYGILRITNKTAEQAWADGFTTND